MTMLIPCPRTDELQPLTLDRIRVACEAEDFPEFDLERRLMWRTRPVVSVPIAMRVLGRSAGSFQFHPRTWVALVCSVFGAVIVSLMTLQEDFPLNIWQSLMTGLFGGAAAGVLIYVTGVKKSRCVDVNFQTKIIRWGRRELEHECRFADVARFVVRGIRSEENIGRRRRRKTIVEYRSRLEIDVRSRRRIVLLETDQWRSSANQPFHDLAPLAERLAQSISVPWEWVDYPRSGNGMRGVLTPARILRARYVVPIFVVIMLLISWWRGP